MDPAHLQVALYALLLGASACGAVDSGSSRDVQTKSAAGQQTISLETTCREVLGPDGIDVSAIKISRNESPTQRLRLLLEQVPMTCAKSVKANVTFDTAETLVVDLAGQGYQHCTCAFDFKPFDVDVPAQVQSNLLDYTLALKRTDVSADALFSARIGDLPTIQE